MSLKVSDNAAKQAFEPIPAGTYPARCVGLVDLGVQINAKFGKEQPKVRIIWELPTETIERNGETEPRWISKPYTASLHEKSELRKDLESWRGKSFTSGELQAFDLTSVVDAPCMLSITHKTAQSGKMFAAVSSVSQPMRGIAVPALKNPPLLFDFDYPREQMLSALEALPEWMQNEVKKSVTWQQMFGQQPQEQTGKVVDVFADELPWET